MEQDQQSHKTYSKQFTNKTYRLPQSLGTTRQQCKVQNSDLGIRTKCNWISASYKNVAQQRNVLVFLHQADKIQLSQETEEKVSPYEEQLIFINNFQKTSTLSSLIGDCSG